MAKRTKISEEEKEIQRLEAVDILYDIISKWIPTLNEIFYPTIYIKMGGYSAIASQRLKRIGLNFYVWRKSLLGYKRMLLIHELIHCLGWNHSGIKLFTNSLDLMSIMIYLKVYGKDNEWDEILGLIKKGIENLENNKYLVT